MKAAEAEDVQVKRKTDKLASLGELEVGIMRILWAADGPLDVNGVVQGMGGTRAYTTVMTTLDRLYKKGYLFRAKEGRAFVYQAKVPQEAVMGAMLDRVAQMLCGGDLRQLIPQLLGQDERLTDSERKRIKAIANRIQDVEKK